MSTRERLYVETIRAEWRVMSRFQRWLFSRSAPFTAIAARHLAEDSTEYLLAEVGHTEKKEDRSA